MIQDVYIIGATGNVGSTLTHQIPRKRDTDGILHSNPTRIVGVASSTHRLYSPTGLTREKAFYFASGARRGASRYSDLDEILDDVEIGTRTGNSLVFIDATAALDSMTRFHKQVILETPYGIVTANKNPITLSDYETFQLLTGNRRRYGYSCSVMAGSDAVPFLRALPDLNEPLYGIEGCFSGTLGYVAYHVARGRKLSDVVMEAYRKGYTEPDPRDDLNGIDVARKLVVLARSAGSNAEMRHVKVNPFIPPEYFKRESVKDFMERLKRSPLDKDFAQLVIRARKSGNTIKYVGAITVTGNKLQMEASLKEVPVDSSLGTLKGTRNQIVIQTESYPKKDPYTIEAPGAGLRVTARNIRRDLLELLPERISGTNSTRANHAKHLLKLTH